MGMNVTFGFITTLTIAYVLSRGMLAYFECQSARQFAILYTACLERGFDVFGGNIYSCLRFCFQSSIVGLNHAFFVVDKAD